MFMHDTIHAYIHMYMHRDWEREYLHDVWRGRGFSKLVAFMLESSTAGILTYSSLYTASLIDSYLLHLSLDIYITRKKGKKENIDLCVCVCEKPQCVVCMGVQGRGKWRGGRKFGFISTDYI